VFGVLTHLLRLSLKHRGNFYNDPCIGGPLAPLIQQRLFVGLMTRVVSSAFIMICSASALLSSPSVATPAGRGAVMGILTAIAMTAYMCAYALPVLCTRRRPEADADVDKKTH